MKQKNFQKNLIQYFGVKIDEKNSSITNEIPQDVSELLEERKKARANKDWEKSDKLRDLIQSKGYIVKDTKDGIEITKIQ